MFRNLIIFQELSQNGIKRSLNFNSSIGLPVEQKIAYHEVIYNRLVQKMYSNNATDVLKRKMLWSIGGIGDISHFGAKNFNETWENVCN